MPSLIHHFISQHPKCHHEKTALIHKDKQFNYRELEHEIEQVSDGLVAHGLEAGDRAAIYLPKLPETVFSLFGTAQAGGVFVPINPLLKPQQVSYILRDCNVRILITSKDRFAQLKDVIATCPNLKLVILLGDKKPDFTLHNVQVLNWNELLQTTDHASTHRRNESDVAAILYTSGSTGNPKGVVLSHRNMVAGAESVAEYLKNTSEDRLLAVLPFSFDYGLSQMTTAFSVGASVVLMDYLLPRDVIKAADRYEITGLAAVPPLWNQLVQLEWPESVTKRLRYITNSGGAMPVATTQQFRQSLPNTDIVLMYGLTEAFRSTYLAPNQVDIRPESMGKAIPNAEIIVVREDGTECEAGEAGELVHKGPLVSMGYWNDANKTAERFKPTPNQLPELKLIETAVWSGDQVKRDEEGYLYFISRKDEMIKTSGYRVSPTEVEEVLYSLGLVEEVAALGIPHPMLGQAIALIVKPSGTHDKATILKQCMRELPNFMVPKEVILLETLPRNQNGKIDRKSLSTEYHNLFQEPSE